MDKKIRKVIVWGLVAVVLCSCKNTNTKKIEKSSQNQNVIEKIDNGKEQLEISKENAAAFILNGEEIVVKDEMSVVTSIEQVEWLNDKDIVVYCHVNPSLDYLTVYDAEKKVFTYGKYGVNFIWKDNDITTLVYVDTSSHFAEENENFFIMNYNGKKLYETSNTIYDIQYEKNTIIYTEITTDGKKVEGKLNI